MLLTVFSRHTKLENASLTVLLLVFSRFEETKNALLTLLFVVASRTKQVANASLTVLLLVLATRTEQTKKCVADNAVRGLGRSLHGLLTLLISVAGSHRFLLGPAGSGGAFK